jgi:hypothetical protein
MPNNRVRPTLANPQASPKQAATARLSVGDIIAALPHLTKQDLTAIQIAVDKELILNIKIDEDLYYSVFEVVNEKPIAISKFSNSTNGALWRGSQSAFMGLVDKLFVVSDIDQSRAAPRIVLHALKKFLVQLIIEDIKARFMPVSLKTICQELGHIEAIVDRAFPDYLKNGLGHLIVSQLRGNN